MPAGMARKPSVVHRARSSPSASRAQARAPRRDACRATPARTGAPPAPAPVRGPRAGARPRAPSSRGAPAHDSRHQARRGAPRARLSGRESARARGAAEPRMPRHGLRAAHARDHAEAVLRHDEARVVRARTRSQSAPSPCRRRRQPCTAATVHRAQIEEQAHTSRRQRAARAASGDGRAPDSVRSPPLGRPVPPAQTTRARRVVVDAPRRHACRPASPRS